MVKVCELGSGDGPVGIVFFVPLGLVDRVSQMQGGLAKTAAAALGVSVRWVRVQYALAARV